MQIGKRIKRLFGYDDYTEFNVPEIPLTPEEKQRIEFHRIMRVVECDLEWLGNTTAEKVEILDSYIEILKKGMEYEEIANFIVRERYAHNIEKLRGFDLIDETGKCRLPRQLEDRLIDLKKTTVIVKPWNSERYQNAVHFSPYETPQPDHKVEYFPTMDIAFVKAGNHSITEGLMHHDQVLVNAQVFDDMQLLSNVYTDGTAWYSPYNNLPISLSLDCTNPVSMKYAIIFALTQRKLEVQDSIKSITASILNRDEAMRKALENLINSIIEGSDTVSVQLLDRAPLCGLEGLSGRFRIEFASQPFLRNYIEVPLTTNLRTIYTEMMKQLSTLCQLEKHFAAIEMKLKDSGANYGQWDMWQ